MEFKFMIKFVRYPDSIDDYIKEYHTWWCGVGGVVEEFYRNLGSGFSLLNDFNLLPEDLDDIDMTLKLDQTCIEVDKDEAKKCGKFTDSFYCHMIIDICFIDKYIESVYIPQEKKIKLKLKKEIIELIRENNYDEEILSEKSKKMLEQMKEYSRIKEIKKREDNEKYEKMEKDSKSDKKHKSIFSFWRKA